MKPGWSDEAPADYVHRIARIKAEMGRMRLLQRGLADLPVLAADTAVAVNGRIFGKPENPTHAEEMLRDFPANPSGIDRGSGGYRKWDSNAHFYVHSAISRYQRT